LASSLALRFLATRRRAYGGGGYNFSAGEQARRSEEKSKRETADFWSMRKRAAQRGAQPKSDRYWGYEEKKMFQAAHVSRGINFDKYNDIPVETSGGQGTEEPIESFAQACEKFGLAQELSDNLARCGYDKPTPVQKYSLPSAMVGTDVMCSAQTGSGKTAAFLVPLVATILKEGAQVADEKAVGPSCVVMAPSRELCQQIAVEAKRLCFKTTVRVVSIYGGAPAADQLRELADGCDIAICTPGRLDDFLNRGVLTMEKVRHLTLDEADRMLDMGFEPQIRRIIEDHGMPEPGLGEDERQTTMFSATFPQEMQDMALDFLDPGYIQISVGRVGSMNADVEQRFVDAANGDKFDALLRSIEEVTDGNGKVAKTLVFANMKSTVDDIRARLEQNNIRASCIHGGLAQPQRDRALAALKRGSVQAVVATDVAARGLDIPGIDHVVNFDLPGNSEDYVHRIGRTGRIGNKGIATSLVGYRENSLQNIVRLLQEQDGEGVEVPEWLEEKAVGGRGGRSHGGPPPF